MADPYVAGLTMLARRELSEKQVRQRLTRLGHAEDAVAAAIARLKADGSLDDARVAGAIARTETGIRRRGRLRVKQRLSAAGIADAIAERALDEVFDTLDVDALISAALEKRLKGRAAPADRRELARLYRHLTSQGFESERVLRSAEDA